MSIWPSSTDSRPFWKGSNVSSRSSELDSSAVRAVPEDRDLDREIDVRLDFEADLPDALEAVQVST